MIEKIENNLRRDMIDCFREWLCKPETQVRGVERFWEYKIKLLLQEIDFLQSELSTIIEAAEPIIMFVGLIHDEAMKEAVNNLEETINLRQAIKAPPVK